MTGQVPELWSIEQVAEYFGQEGKPLSLARARHLVADNGIRRVCGYPADEVKAIPRPGQGARTDLDQIRDNETEPQETS